MRIIIITFLVFQCCFAVAQNNIGHGIDSDLSDIGNISGMYAIGTFDKSDKSMEGSTLLFDDLNYGYFKLKVNKDIAKEPVEFNYNMQTRQFVLKLKDNYYTIQSDFVDEVKLLNSDLFIVVQVEKGGYELAEKLVDGRITLLSMPYVTIKKASYNAALDFGSKRDKAIKKNSFYLMVGDDLIELPTKKKKLKKVLKNHPELLEFLNSQKIKLKDRSNLIKVFNNYNNKI